MIEANVRQWLYTRSDEFGGCIGEIYGRIGVLVNSNCCFSNYEQLTHYERKLFEEVNKFLNVKNNDLDDFNVLAHATFLNTLPKP